MSTDTPGVRPGSAALAGRRTAQPHRVVLSNGKTLSGSLYRDANIRLSDHIAGLKGFLAMTDAVEATSGEMHPFIVINIDHIVSVEEVN